MRPAGCNGQLGLVTKEDQFFELIRPEPASELQDDPPDGPVYLEAPKPFRPQVVGGLLVVAGNLLRRSLADVDLDQ